MGIHPQFAVRRGRLDSQFDAMIRDAFGNNLAAVWTPAARFVQSGDDVFVDLELPGVRAEDIAVDVLDDTLVVAGRRDLAAVPEGEKVLVNEMKSGSFRREFKLGTRIDVESVSAEYLDGILRIRLSALVAAHRPARIEVRTAGRSQGDSEQSTTVAEVDPQPEAE
ncbi:MAG: Hsp20/alpha crystallin family protein [Actinobacteria bacterium]|nr:Hsp20/alpha crystallin family protein [Actinomycetota bacterium]